MKDKLILDACCGSRMFWFDRHHPDTLYIDIRDADIQWEDRRFSIHPDLQADFTQMPFEDESFSLVVFDPPHLKRAGSKSWMKAKYGTLDHDWKTQIRKGFEECFRVLKPHGILIFKWSEVQIPLSEILPLADREPLFGNRKPKQSGSHWICFMK